MFNFHFNALQSSWCWLCGIRCNSMVLPGWIPCLAWKLLKVLPHAWVLSDYVAVDVYGNLYGIYSFSFPFFLSCTLIISFTCPALRWNIGRMSKQSRLTFQTRKQEHSKPSRAESWLSWATKTKGCLKWQDIVFLLYGFSFRCSPQGRLEWSLDTFPSPTFNLIFSAWDEIEGIELYPPSLYYYLF